MTSLLRRGDDGAFTALYDRYWELLLGIAYNRLKDPGRAGDTVNDVLTLYFTQKK